MHKGKDRHFPTCQSINENRSERRGDIDVREKRFCLNRCDIKKEVKARKWWATRFLDNNNL